MSRPTVTYQKAKGHHRRPSSIGGTSDKPNIWEAPRKDPAAHKIEELHHAVFQNMCTPEIAKALDSLWRFESHRVWYARKSKPLHPFICSPTHGCAKICSNFQWTDTRKDNFKDLRRAIADYTRTSDTPEGLIHFYNSHVTDADYTLGIKRIRKSRRRKAAK